MKHLIKPGILKSGDTVATISLSWAGAGLFPDRYEQGKKQIQDTFGLRVVEMPNSLRTDLYDNPQLRLDDFMQAFLDPNIKAIITNIGGSETIRLLQHMTEEHFKIIQNNPKIFIGMSDTTVNHFMCIKAGLSSFYGTSTLFGFAENGGIPELIKNSIIHTLFEKPIEQTLESANEFIIDKVRWGTSTIRERTKTEGWKYIQGTSRVQGRLLGGCVESLNMINGTCLWPSLEEWEDTILFLETSEDMLPPEVFGYFLRNLGAQGILGKVNGILFGRPGGTIKKEDTEKKEKWLSTYKDFDKYLLKVCQEYGRSDMPIVTNMDFGHTVPQILLPYGILTEIDPINKTVKFLEAAVC